MGITSIVIVLFTLELQGAWSGGNVAARHSVHNLLAGRFAVAFYRGTLLIGLFVPAVLASEQVAPLGDGVLAPIGLFSARGDFFIKYNTIRADNLSPAQDASCINCERSLARGAILKERQRVFDKTRRHLAVDEIGPIHQMPEKRQGGLYPGD